MGQFRQDNYVCIHLCLQKFKEKEGLVKIIDLGKDAKTTIE